MKSSFGIDFNKLRTGQRVPVEWDSQKVLNPHVVIVGKSGNGKTTQIRSMIDQLKMDAEKTGKPFRVRVIDVHGDIDLPGCSTVKFSDSSPYGMNPLAINPDPDFGGIRKQIQQFIGIINKATAQLGHKQEAVLKHLLLDLYHQFGFDEKNAQTWALTDAAGRPFLWQGAPKRYPTLNDCLRFAQGKHIALFTGANERTTALLMAHNRVARSIYVKLRALHRAPTVEEKQEAQNELRVTGEKATAAFRDYVESIENGVELTNLIKYDSIDTVKSVVNRIENLLSTGLFKDTAPEFDPRATVWRYDLHFLQNIEEKKMFVYFMLTELFGDCKQRGQSSDLVEFVVLDESNLFFDDDKSNIINIIALEARKFGLGLCCASQNPDHFSADFLSSVATKVVLGLDQTHWNRAIQKLNMLASDLEWITPHKSMLVQVDNRGASKSTFVRTQLV